MYNALGSEAERVAEVLPELSSRCRRRRRFMLGWAWRAINGRS